MPRFANSLVCWNCELPLCSTGAGCSRVMEAVSMDAKAIIALSPTASEQKSARGSCTPTMDWNLLLCPWGRRCKSWRIGAAASARSGAQPLQGIARPRTNPSPRSCQRNTGAHASSTPTDLRSESSVELEHHLSPSNGPRIWLYLNLMFGVWNRKVVAWDVGEREDPDIAANLVNLACLRGRNSKGRQRPLNVIQVTGTPCVRP